MSDANRHRLDSTVRFQRSHHRTLVLCSAVLGVLALSSCSEERIEKREDRTARTQAIQRVAIASTVIPTAGYDAAGRVLEIEFHNGAVYQYFDVPQYVYDDLKSAGDPAKYFNQHVRNAGYRYRQIGAEGIAAAETAGLRNSHEHEQND